MNFSLEKINSEDVLQFKKDMQEAFQKGFEFGIKLKNYTPKQRYGKPVHHILKNETFIFMSINVVFILWNINASTITD